MYRDHLPLLLKVSTNPRIVIGADRYARLLFLLMMKSDWLSCHLSFPKCHLTNTRYCILSSRCINDDIQISIEVSINSSVWNLECVDANVIFSSKQAHGATSFSLQKLSCQWMMLHEEITSHQGSCSHPALLFPNQHKISKNQYPWKFNTDWYMCYAAYSSSML